ncbi:glycosyltransferase [Paenibacillus tengchongensis]|uniref:glycosyltransferase n=1 Tax=Paenibacillus tengchongensis TaxID=2608684 RepID=UPI00124EF8A2|nr:glycosyltransferase [Paenibacillus tengchongensis]
MKILYVTLRLPYPTLKGDQNIVFNRLKTLSKKHEIVLLSLYQKEEDLIGVEVLEKYCCEVHTVKLSKWRSLMNTIKGYYKKFPLQVVYYKSGEFQKKVDSLIEKHEFDIVNGFLLRTAPYFLNIKGIKILDLIDSMQLNLERSILKEAPPKSWILKNELKRIIKYERQIGKSFDHMLLVSDKDKVYFDDSNVSVIPLGVDTNSFKPVNRENRKNKIIFTGNMSYAPNVHAVKWFADNCFPEINKAEPDVEFVIAGVSPSKEVLNLGKRPGIKVMGFVESLPEILNDAIVSIAPMQSGSGMQNKILEAMACGLTVITTSLGVGSIDVSIGKDILIADNAEEFVSLVLKVLNNSEMRNEIGRNAREFVMKNHSWEHIGCVVDELYEKLMIQADL